MENNTEDLVPNGDPHPLLGVAVIMSFVLGLLMALAAPLTTYQTAEAHGSNGDATSDVQGAAPHIAETLAGERPHQAQP